MGSSKRASSNWLLHPPATYTTLRACFLGRFCLQRSFHMYLELSRSGADVFGRALTCLYRVNEYATVLPKNDGVCTQGFLDMPTLHFCYTCINTYMTHQLLISSANISRSAFASFLFTRDFFSKCKHTTVNERPENKSAYQLSLVVGTVCDRLIFPFDQNVFKDASRSFEVEILHT